MNKVNLCWVLSEGRRGHEIQSMALAQTIAAQTQLFTFNLKQPWETFTPRLIPGFKSGLQWLNSISPNLDHAPQVIITTGRKAAAAGKFLTQHFRNDGIQVVHIQILDPKDSPDNYGMLLIPKHDLKTGNNIINYTGSIHPYDRQWYKRTTTEESIQCSVILGNPPCAYFRDDFTTEIKAIRKRYPKTRLLFCGSPRMSKETLAITTKQLRANDEFWHSDSHGENPYQTILRQSNHIFVTADSINMMNECASSHAAITLLARNHLISKKHQRFIKSIEHRWSTFTTEHLIHKPIPYVLEHISHHKKFQKLLNSPA